MTPPPDTPKLDSTKDIDEKIAQLLKLREDIIRKEKRTQIRQVVKTMKEFEITLEEVGKEISRQNRNSSSLNDILSIDRPRVPPKFRHPETGEEWSGRGIAPRWIRDAEKDGRSRDEFLINGNEENANKEQEQVAISESMSKTAQMIAGSPIPKTSGPALFGEAPYLARSKAPKPHKA